MESIFKSSAYFGITWILCLIIIPAIGALLLHPNILQIFLSIERNPQIMVHLDKIPRASSWTRIMTRVSIGLLDP